MLSQSESLLRLIPQTESAQAFASSYRGWQADTDVCDWYGISCDDNNNNNRQVTSLSLTHIPLGGSLPTELGNLTRLRQLILVNCALQGGIPAELAHLRYLETIDVSQNQLTGSIPVFESKRLKLHLLARNHLSGTLSEDMFLSPRLQTIDWKNNQLSGPIPRLWTDMPLLTEVDISNNQLTGSFPVGVIAVAPILERLYLSNNELVGSIPEEITTGQESSLREVYIDGNQLTGSLAVSLAELPQLQVLWIHNNRLTGTVPEELCRLRLNDILFDGDTAYVLGDKQEVDGFHRRERELQRFATRDGCNSIACPSGSQSSTGMFPCTPCSSAVTNPYLGATTCREVTQEAVLEKLFTATNGDDWTDTRTWKGSIQNACALHGIACDEQDRVVRVELSGRNLNGHIPLELGFLPNLVELDLSHNRLQGTVPEELAIPPLQKLDLSENFLTGYLPTSVCVKKGINGNGQHGRFSCDIVTCPMGTFHPNGNADPGIHGQPCTPCRLVDGHVLGNTNCGGPIPSDFKKASHRERGIAIFLLTLIGVSFVTLTFFVWRRYQGRRMVGQRHLDPLSQSPDLSGRTIT